MAVIAQKEIDRRLEALTPRQKDMYNAVTFSLQTTYPTDRDFDNLAVVLALFVDVMETVIAED